MARVDGKRGASTPMMQSELLQSGMHGAFVRDGFDRPGAAAPSSTQLAGLRLAVKDVFDVAGLRTGAGNPAWWQTQAIAERSALAVSALLAAGAQWVGKTVTDELAYSLTGANIHYGTPCNPAAPNRLPGGSSSGSAVAVAAGHADIGLATDCGGSARLPASYCGVWGIRPSHGLAGSSGFALAPSFDTVGWFSRSGEVLLDVLRVLAPDVDVGEPRTWLIPQDALALCHPGVQAAMASLLHKLPQPHKLLPLATLPLAAWARAYKVLAGAEIWSIHGAWVQENAQHLAADVLERFLAASRITADEVAVQQRIRNSAIEQLGNLLTGGAMVVMPTAPGPAPLCSSSASVLQAERLQVQQLVSGAGLARLPQVSLPWLCIAGAPVGLSVLGARGQDGTVVQAAKILSASAAFSNVC